MPKKPLSEILLALKLGVDEISVVRTFDGPVQKEWLDDREYEFACGLVEWSVGGRLRAGWVPVATKIAEVGQSPFTRRVLREDTAGTLSNLEKMVRADLAKPPQENAA